MMTEIDLSRHEVRELYRFVRNHVDEMEQEQYPLLTIEHKSGDLLEYLAWWRNLRDKLYAAITQTATDVDEVTDEEGEPE